MTILLTDQIIVRELGLQDYVIVERAMHRFSQQRHNSSPDEIWLVQHPPVFTQGKAGKAEHLLVASQVPVIQTDRGGQITYHGPGQQIMYVLLDLKRKNINIRQLVNGLENCVIETLKQFDITGHSRQNAPGVYVDQAKICSLGLRITHGCSLHGLALNIDMDLQPFKNINPCGYADLRMTQIKDFNSTVKFNLVTQKLLTCFMQVFSYSSYQLTGWSAQDYD